jgi:O-antigen ligase
LISERDSRKEASLSLNESGLSAGRIFRQAGTFIILVLAFSGVFARGIANGAYGALLLWAIIFFFLRKSRGMRKVPGLPKLFLYGAGVYFGILLLTSLLSQDIPRSLRYFGLIFYLLCLVPAVWMVLSQNRTLIPRILPFFYGAGLIVAAIMTFREANYSLACVRGKASLGVIELGAVLGQTIPLMVGAAAIYIKDRRKLVFFIITLIFGYVSLRVNCARIALLAAPFLSLVMFIVFRKLFGKTLCLLFAAIILIGGATVLLDKNILNRFRQMTDLSGSVAANEVRFTRWRQGVDVFLEHPILGIGPNSIPNVPCESIIAEVGDCSTRHTKYYHAHHVFFTVLAESGVVGLLGLLALHVFPLIYIMRARKSEDILTRFWVWSAVVVALQLLLNGLVDNVFSLKPLMYIYWTVTTIAMWKVRERESLGELKDGPKGRSEELITEIRE